MADSDNEYDFDDFHDDDEEIHSQHKSRATSASAARTVAKAHSVDDEYDVTSIKAGGQMTYGNLKDQNNTVSGRHDNDNIDSDDEYLISFPPSTKASVKQAEPLSRKIVTSLPQQNNSQLRRPVHMLDNTEAADADEVQELADDVVTDEYGTDAGYSRGKNNAIHSEPAIVSPIKEQLVKQGQQNLYNQPSAADTAMDTADDTVLDNTQLQHTAEYQEYDFEFEDDEHSLAVDDSIVAVASPVHHTTSNTYTDKYGSTTVHSASGSGSQENAAAEVEDRAYSTYYSSPTRTQQQSLQQQRVVSNAVSYADTDATEVEDTAVPAGDVQQYIHGNKHSDATTVSHVYDNVDAAYEHSLAAAHPEFATHTQPDSHFDSSKLSMLKKKSQQKRKRAIQDDEIIDAIALEGSDTDAVVEPAAPESPSKKAHIGKHSSNAGPGNKSAAAATGTTATSTTVATAVNSAGEAIKNEFRLLGLDAMSPEVKEMKPKLSLIHQKTASRHTAHHAAVSPVASTATTTTTESVHSVPSVRQSIQVPALPASVSARQDKRGSSLASANKVMMSVYAPGHPAAASKPAAGPGNSVGAAGADSAMKRNAYGKYQPAKKTSSSVTPAATAVPAATELPVHPDGSAEGSVDAAVPAELPAGARRVSFTNVGKWKPAAQPPAVEAPAVVARMQQRVSLKPALPVRKIRLGKPTSDTSGKSDGSNVDGTRSHPADSEGEYVMDSATENTNSMVASAAAGGNVNPGQAHRKVRLPSSVGAGGSASHKAPEITGASTAVAGTLQPKPPTKPSLPKQHAHPPSHSTTHSAVHTKEKEVVMPASILEENSTYSTLLDAHSTYSEDDVNYQLHQHSGDHNQGVHYNDSSKGINSGTSEHEGSSSTVKMHANENENSVGTGSHKKAARFADVSSDVHNNVHFESSDIQDDTSYHSYGEDSPREQHQDHSRDHEQRDARYAYDEHARHVTHHSNQQHQQGGKVSFAADDHSGDYAQYNTPHHHRQQPDTSRSAPEHHGNQNMYHNNTHNPNHPGNPYATNSTNQGAAPVRRRSKGAAGRAKRPGKQHFYHPQQPQRQDTEKNNPRVVKYNRGRDWMADPSHRYDESTGLFSSFETDAKREFRKEQARVNALLERQAAEREAEAARKAYLQRRHELEVQALLREQAHLSEASNREERYEAALAQHKLAEMKTLQEREEVRAKMQLLSEITVHSKNQYIKYASNFMGPPPPSAQVLEAQLKHNMQDSPGSPKRHYAHHSPHTPPSHDKSYEKSWERSAEKSDKGEKIHYFSSGDEQSPSGPGKSAGRSAGSRRKHTAPKSVSGDESVSSYGSGGGNVSAVPVVKTAVPAPAVAQNNAQNNAQGGARYPRKGRQIVEQRTAAPASNVYGNKVKVISSSAAAPAVPKPAGLQPGKPLQAHPPAPRSYSDHSHHHHHGQAQHGNVQVSKQQVQHHQPHHHQQHNHMHALDNGSHSTVVDLHTGSVDSVLTDSAGPSMMEYRNNSSAYFSHDSSMLQETDQAVDHNGVAMEVEDSEDVLTELHRSSSTSLKGNRRSMNEILSAAASKVKVDLFGDEVDVSSIQHDIDAGLVSYHTSNVDVHDLYASQHPHDHVLDADSAYYMVQVQSMVGIDATDVKNIEIHDFYSDSPRHLHATASGSGAHTPGLTPGLTLEDAFNFAGELDLPDEGEGEVAEQVDDGAAERDAYSDDGWEADELTFERADEYATGSVGEEEVPDSAGPEFESQHDHQAHHGVKPHRAATPKRSATAVSAGDEYVEDFDNEYADESFEQPSSRAASSAVPSAVPSAVSSVVPTYRSAMHVHDVSHSDITHQHAHASFAVAADDDAVDDDDDTQEHFHHHSIVGRKATPVRRTKLVSPPAPAPAPDAEVESLPTTPEPTAVVPAVAGRRKSTPAGKRAPSAASQHSQNSQHSQDYGDDEFEADGDFEPYEPEETAKQRDADADEFAPLENDHVEQEQPGPQNEVLPTSTHNVFDNTAALSVDSYSNTLFSQLTTTEEDNSSLDFTASFPNSPLLGLGLGSSVDFQDSLAFSTASQSNTLSYSPEKAPTWSNTLASDGHADTGTFSYYISQNNSVFEGEEAEPGGAHQPTEHELPPSAYPEYLTHTKDSNNSNSNYVNNSAQDDDDDLEELPASAPRTAQSDGYGGYDNDFDDYEPEETPAENANFTAHAAAPVVAAVASTNNTAVDVAGTKAAPAVASIGCASDDSGDGDLHQFMHSKSPKFAAVPSYGNPVRTGGSTLPAISQQPNDVNASAPAVVRADSNKSQEVEPAYTDDFADDNVDADIQSDGARSQELLFFNDGQDLTANPHLAADDVGYGSDQADGREDEVLARVSSDKASNKLDKDWSTGQDSEPVEPAAKLAYSVRGFSMVVNDTEAADLFARGAKPAHTSAATGAGGSKTYDAKKSDLLQRIQQQQLLEGSDSDVDVEVVKAVKQPAAAFPSKFVPPVSNQVEAPAPAVTSHVQRGTVHENNDAIEDDLYADFETAVTIGSKAPSMFGAKNDSVTAPATAKETAVQPLPPLVSSALPSLLPAIKQASFRADSTTSAKPASKAPYNVRGFSMVVSDADAVDLFGRDANSSTSSSTAGGNSVGKTYDAKKSDLLQRIQQQQLLEGSDSDVAFEKVKQPSPPPATSAPVLVAPSHHTVDDHHDTDRYENDEFAHDEVDQLDISNDTSGTGTHSPSRHHKNKAVKKDKKSKHSKHGKHKKTKTSKGDKYDGSVEEGDADDGYSSEGSEAPADQPLHNDTADEDVAPARSVVVSPSPVIAPVEEPAAVEPVTAKASSSLKSPLLTPLPSLAAPQTYGKLPQLGFKASTSPTTCVPAVSYHPLDDEGYGDDEYDFENAFAASAVSATATSGAVRGAALISAPVPAPAAPASALLPEPEPLYDDHVDFSGYEGDDAQKAEPEEQDEYTHQHKNKSPKKDKKSKHSKHGKHKKAKTNKGDKHHKGAVEDLVMSDGEEESGFSSDGSGTASPVYQTVGAGEHAVYGESAQDEYANAGYPDTSQAGYEGYEGQESYGYAGADDQLEQPGGYQQYTNPNTQYPDSYDPYAAEHGVENGTENYEFAADDELLAFSPSSKAQKSSKQDTKDKDSSSAVPKHKKDKKEKKSKSKHKHKHKGKKHKNEGSVGSAEALDDFESDSSEDTESTAASPVPVHHQHQQHHNQYQQYQQPAYDKAAAADHFGEDEFDF